MSRSCLALIPARGGSKGVPRKNLQLLGGHPLVAWAIAAAQGAGIESIVVSSDDAEILAVACRYGAEPLERPAHCADDTATDSQVIDHARDALGWSTGELIVYLRPTTPLRNPAMIRAALRLLERTPEASSLRSVHLAVESVFKWYRADGAGWLRPISGLYVDGPRQNAPPVWVPNGYCDIVRRAHWGEHVLGFTVTGLEVDSVAQLDYLRHIVSQSPFPLQGALDVRQRLAVAS